MVFDELITDIDIKLNTWKSSLSPEVDIGIASRPSYNQTYLCATLSTTSDSAVILCSLVSPILFPFLTWFSFPLLSTISSSLPTPRIPSSSTDMGVDWTSSSKS
ncbi:hypothetical protein K443DRAFT_8514 [Laccaria amethystina LaAM-08-1]|uniref:Uncharacterized protein n=1 Tax=Laccaria amethystina LaAM-08-1 TaxID=1095629 RepID=A0A0C9XTT8_9AGAR|nr:hypothetical protein K443DRAFT_14643 [Laccaria amethystina LaAM-08-1]KIJ99342.1 hypothetical protein K443DRAFT_8514 [Laccaria amethystina LaAM-08-1]